MEVVFMSFCFVWFRWLCTCAKSCLWVCGSRSRRKYLWLEPGCSSTLCLQWRTGWLVLSWRVSTGVTHRYSWVHWIVSEILKNLIASYTFLTCCVSQDGLLALPSVLHSEVALLVAEAYQKYLTDKPNSGLISEGIKQVCQQPDPHFSTFIIHLCVSHPSLFSPCRCPTLPASFVWVCLLKHLSVSGRGRCCCGWNSMGMPRTLKGSGLCLLWRPALLRSLHMLPACTLFSGL